MEVKWWALAAFLAGVLLAAVGGYSVAEWFHTPPSTAIAYAGSILNVFGLVLVATELTEKRSKFGLPSLAERLVAAVSRWWRRKPQVVGISASDTVNVKADASAHVGFGYDLTATDLKRRVDLLEEEIRLIRHEHVADVQRLDKSIANVEAQIAAEIRERRTEQGQIRDTLREMEVGGLHVGWLGFWWLLIGETLTGFSDPIARLLFGA